MATLTTGASPATKSQSIKVGVNYGLADGSAMKLPQLIEIQQEKRLTDIIQFLCQEWNIKNPENYALMPEEDNGIGYITDSNRHELKPGFVLKLVHSPSMTSKKILESLQNRGASYDTLRAFSELSADKTFAQEFIGNMDGFSVLVKAIENGLFVGEQLSYVLKAFVELMDHEIVSWDNLDAPFVKAVALATCTGKSSVEMYQRSLLQSALEILESILLKSTGKYLIVEQEITVPNIMIHLQSADSMIQRRALSLINALFDKAEDSHKKRKIAQLLQEKSNRNVILNYVINEKSLETDMAHQLHVLQQLLFNQLEIRSQTQIDVGDPNVMKEIQELKKASFDTEDTTVHPVGSAKRQSKEAQEYKRLGFTNTDNPAEDFIDPPGVLAFDNIIHFSKFHQEKCTKVVNENYHNELPFVKASIELTRLLCEVLQIGEPPQEDGITYYPMFWKGEHSFEEFFCVCVQLLNKTWKEMRATYSDFCKVLNVVKDQIGRSLRDQPITIDKFETSLLSYTKITKLWEKERKDQETAESQSKPVKELRARLEPEIIDLIKQQRLQYLKEGTRFKQYKKKTKTDDKILFWRLSHNHKILYYGEWDNQNHGPTNEQLNNKVSVVEIKSIYQGHECPGIEKRKGKVDFRLAFCIEKEGDPPETYDFIAPHEESFFIWTDGLNALLGNQMNSQKAKQDATVLLDMEVKLRLLDTEGIAIPDTPPPIPEDPPSFDFVYS